MNNRKSDLDFKSACRACLRTAEGKMDSLFSLYNKEMLSKMFSDITSIQIEHEENLPLQVCSLCCQQLIKSYKFRLKCRESDSYIRSFIDSEKSISTETRIDSSESIVNCNNNDGLKEKDQFEIEVKVEDHDQEEIEYLEEEVFSAEDKYLIPDINKSENIITSVQTVTSKNKSSGKPKTTKDYDKFECEVCYKKFKNLRMLNVHINKYHIQEDDLAFPCGQCKESFNSEHDLHLHSALHTPVDNVWMCNKCQKVFKGRTALRRHIRYHMEHKRHACACGKTFAERCALLRHARVHTGQLALKNFVCEYCDKRFIDRAALGAHVARHTGERAHACACGAAFRSARLLRSHRRVHDDHRPHACTVCDKRFRHASTLRTHSRTHSGERPYVCAACGKTFIQHSNLTLHARTHTGEKPYRCDFCGRQFSSGSSLSAHRRTHTGEKPYCCPVCGKRFARMDMTAHMRRHWGERPHACAACGKRFTTAARRDQHMLVHTAENPYECGVCSEKFKRKAYLARHMKSHKGDDTKSNRVSVVQLAPPRENVIVSNYSRKTDEERASDRCETAPEYHDHDVPLDVSQALILDDSDVKNEVVVIDEGSHISYQNEVICLDSQEIQYDRIELVDDVESKLDDAQQFVMQIETVEGQLMIKKITSE
ncbi:gastrula zinc finger protein XlCGF26.1-like isoform X2 [Aricia agestis]|uniref:gastrula zinc finger protein XlCGF26.1-like isoform X2 n=1 Tax=Aricia agestis TaxID=91739 RepID=UPI001C20A9D4|nr:gastrula zinc finger protein XlCGF26.1-like isoform X2 [Aricia agestis]